MTSQMVSVDETLSFAHRAGGEVRVRLRLPAGTLSAGPAEVRLGAARKGFRVPADVTADEQGTTVDFAAPGGRLRQRVWTLAVHPSPDAAPVSVEARVLARRDLPVALLPGPVPTTRLPEPSPRQETNVALRAARRLPRPVKRALRRARAAAGRRGA
jgi:hypothetical protein